MKSPGHPDNDEGSGVGCLGMIILLIGFLGLGPPLMGVALDFWSQLGCLKGWWACGKHMIEWNLQ